MKKVFHPPFILGIFSFLSLFFLNTCKDVDGLSRDAEVLDFKIISYSPNDNISLGTPEIVNDTILYTGGIRGDHINENVLIL